MKKREILTTEGRRFTRSQLADAKLKANTTFSTKGAFEIPSNIITVDPKFKGHYSDPNHVLQSVSRVISEDLVSFYKGSVEFNPPFNIKNAKIVKVDVGYDGFWCIAIELHDESEKKRWLMTYYRTPSPGALGRQTQRGTPIFTEILTKTFKISDIPLELIHKNPLEAKKAIEKASEKKTSDILKKSTREKLGGMFD